MNQKLYNSVKKLNAGPGGIKCNCCNPFYPARSKRVKQLCHRMLRRVMKFKLKLEFNHAISE